MKLTPAKRLRPGKRVIWWMRNSWRVAEIHQYDALGFWLVKLTPLGDTRRAHRDELYELPKLEKP